MAPSTNTRNIVTLAVLVLMLALPTQVKAAATCFCKVSYVDLTGKESATNVITNLTGEVNHKYKGINQQGPATKMIVLAVARVWPPSTPVAKPRPRRPARLGLQMEQPFVLSVPSA